MSTPPILSKPEAGESLIVYLSTTKHAISSILVREEGRQQKPVYYVRKRLLGAESCYLSMEKLALSLVNALRKLRPYFDAHQIRVYTDQPLRKVLAKLETSGRLLKWVVELRQFEITYHTITTIKGQAFADFIVECADVEDFPDENTLRDVWKLFVDGSATDNASGARIILVMSIGHKFHSVLRFKFEATNNESEYEVLLAGLRMAIELKAKAIR